MTDVQVRVYKEPTRGPRMLVSAWVVDEADAHDTLRDLLEAAGVPRPERAILEGGPVFDTDMTHHVSWEVEDLSSCPFGCAWFLDDDSRCSVCKVDRP